MGRKAYKLTDDQVREIRANRHGLSYKKQAEKYGVHIDTIKKIHYLILRTNVI